MSVDYSQPTAPPPVPPPPPVKKGLGPLGWILIGCGGILVICLIAMGACFAFAKHKIGEFSKNPEMNAAKLIVAANPDLELVKADDDAKTLTVRDKKTGEETTLNLDDVKNGKIKIGSGKGSATIDMNGGENGGMSATVTDEKGQQSTFHAGAGGEANLPDWLPNYPGGKATGTYDTTTPEGRAAAVTVATQDPIETVLDFYEGKLKAAGLTVQKNTSSDGGKMSGGTLSGASSDQKRSATIVVTSGTDGSQAVVSFNEKN